MRIFSKKSFQFDHPAGADASVTVQAGNFVDVPAWVSDSLMFKLANSDGDVELITSRADEIAAETGVKTKTKAELKAEKEAEEKAKADAAKAEADALLAQQQ